MADSCHLRVVSGLSAKTEQAARMGRAKTLVAVQVRWRQQVIGLGRLLTVDYSPSLFAGDLRIRSL